MTADTPKRGLNIASYIIPEFMLPGVINDDWSGLDETDHAAWTAFRRYDQKRNNHKQFYVLTDTANEGFMAYHDLHEYGIGACNCVTIAVDVGHSEEEQKP